ncbi:MAG: TaqI-like C-terminal specificity domain-containing protein [Nitrospira sp.]|nr:TaqI-like C-terminal specificity domain-containing protein [Nitrospira sp.]
MSQAPPIVAILIDRFERNRDAYKSQGYNETQVRREFLDPFFEALGWDVANRQGHAEAYKDVIHEDAIKIGGNTKAPDYCFRVGGARKFFLEAKKPAVNVKDEIPPAYQLRRYAWSAKLPLSILTDFEEFAVYDCRTRPNASDKSSTGRILYLTYRDYLARWDEIASIFTKEAVLKGSFDKYAVTDRKRGTATVDAEFLKEIETWRDTLAKNLALRNPALTVHELNFSVQRTIDRLIFLRICEDRGVEPYGQLQALLNGQNIYGRLRYLYEQADDRYNSGLFHFHKEKDRAESPDDLTPSLKIDDKVLKEILGRLYYPQSPYEFSVLPTEILGQVYEQFLGKVIRLTSGHQARIEEKPEVKKAGGVYYTPAYIVEYIVKQTVGVLCEGKTPKQIAKLTILDPACGSGSFLLGAYRYLLAYHRDWYVKDGPEKHRKELFQAASGEWRLTTQEKKRILLNNIHGVDIDSQAVEVTKLSLLLKVLEGESDETLKRQLSFVHERALPDLGQNIKCGNSLIGPDYFTGQLMPDDEEMRRVNLFDWKAEFPAIMKAGGFDAVIGNPPYVLLQDQFRDNRQLDYFRSNFKAASFKIDTYHLFIEQRINLCRTGGRFSMITPANFLTNNHLDKLRRVILERSSVHHVVIIDGGVFDGVSVDNAIFVFSPGKRAMQDFRVAHARLEGQQLIQTSQTTVSPAVALEDAHVLYSGTGQSALAKLWKRIAARSCGLGDIADVNFGKQLRDRKKFIKDVIEVSSGSKVPSTHRPCYSGRDINRYLLKWGNLACLNDEIARSGGCWDASKHGAKNKLLTRQIGRYPDFAIDVEGWHCLNTIFMVNLREKWPSVRYVLGILNSKLMRTFWLDRFYDQRHTFPKIKGTYLKQLPIRAVNYSDKLDKVKHDQMGVLVERMLALKERGFEAKTPADKDRLQRQIDATDQEIDRLVYDLYGLTEEEIKIVESASVASSSKVKENDRHESEAESADRPGASRGAPATVAQPAQYPGEGSGGAPEGVAGAGEPVHGVREPAGQYGSSQGAHGNPEGQSELGSTRQFDTAEGRLSYSELSERLAVPLVGIYDEILQVKPDQIVINSEWLCARHKRLAGHLFPDWAGRFRDVDVQVGGHTPPPYYEVPIHMRQFCDDLAERLRHEPDGTLGGCAALLAWADWRFQWIHPFKDFNGRIGRVLLAALLYKICLPHVETAPLESTTRRQYLDALQAADDGNLGPLAELWSHRILDAL